MVDTGFNRDKEIGKVSVAVNNLIEYNPAKMLIKDIKGKLDFFGDFEYVLIITKNDSLRVDVDEINEKLYYTRKNKSFLTLKMDYGLKFIHVGEIIAIELHTGKTVENPSTHDYEEEFIEAEHINNIYNKSGFMGVIEYAKDQLSNYGVVREEEPGLWVMVTGGWSDHEHWLDCLNNPISLFGMKHYCGYTRGGAFYYTEKPHGDIKVVLND